MPGVPLRPLNQQFIALLLLYRSRGQCLVRLPYCYRCLSVDLRRCHTVKIAALVSADQTLVLIITFDVQRSFIFALMQTHSSG